MGLKVNLLTCSKHTALLQKPKAVLECTDLKDLVGKEAGGTLALRLWL
jgi:hypothetical protein